MWGTLEKILEHVTSYSTNAGKVWYLIVFVFRLIIVVTVGQSVYTDEQSAFRCSTKVIGCDNVCYDKFAKISHIRYWAFQLLAVTAPAVIFHFYTLNVKGHVAKIQAEKQKITDAENMPPAFGYLGTDDEINRTKAARRKKKVILRERSVGNFKEKTAYHHTNKVDVMWTRKIRAAYLITIFFRIVLEAISLYIAYTLFHFADAKGSESYNPLGVILIKVPQVYLCQGENVEWACGQHLSLGKSPGYVPCWVSRPWEKTIFMCYMNLLSLLCFILSCIEFAQLSYRYVTNLRIKKNDVVAARRRLSTRFSESPSFYSVDERSGISPSQGRRIRRPTFCEDDESRNASRRTSPSKQPNWHSSAGYAIPFEKVAHAAGMQKKTVGNKPRNSDSYKFRESSESGEYERDTDEEDNSRDTTSGINDV